jgi:hypothetical protein
VLKEDVTLFLLPVLKEDVTLFLLSDFGSDPELPSELPSFVKLQVSGLMGTFVKLQVSGLMGTQLHEERSARNPRVIAGVLLVNFQPSW